MNRREMFAGAVLIITLTIGIVAGTLRQERVEESACRESNDQNSDSYRFSIDAYLRLDVNSASVEELMALPGIGPKKASAIVDWRTCNGPFERIEDLTEVKGIGQKTLALIRAYVSTGGGDSVAGR